MIRRSTRIALEALVGLLLAVVLLSAAVLWRLSEGPVSVDFLTPHLEQAFVADDSPLSVDVGSTELIWSGWERTVDLRARDWQVNGPDGQKVARLPEVDVTLSLRALAQGVIAPTAIEVSGASLTLERDLEGHFGIVEQPALNRSSPARRETSPTGSPSTEMPERAPPRLEAPSAATADTEAPASPPPARDTDGSASELEETPDDIAALLPTVAARLLAPAGPSEPLSFLNSLSGRDLTVTLIDRNLGTVVTARRGSIELFRQDDGISGVAGLSLDLGSQPVTLEANLDYDAVGERLRIATVFRDLDLSQLGELAPELEPLSHAKVPLDGLIDVILTPKGRIETLDFDLASGPGRLSLPDFYEEPVDLAAIAAVGRYDTDQRRIAVEDFSLQLGKPEIPGPDLRARLNLDLGDGFYDLGIGARVDRVDMVELARYWPADVSDNGRNWVLENIAAGAAENLELVTSLRFPDAPDQEPTLNSLGGSFTFSELEVHYLRPMPPVTSVSGTATFDSDGLTFDVSEGQLQELNFGPGTVKIFGLSGEDHRLALDVAVEGGLRPALEVLNHPRLSLIDKLGVPLEGSGGQATALLGFAFPLIDELTDEEIDITASAELSGVALADIGGGLALSDGALSLDLDTRSMTLSGPISLAGLPVELDWTEYFEAQDGVRRKVTASTDALDAAARTRLGLPLADSILGPVAADLRLVSAVDETSEIDVALQLIDAEIDLPPLKWRKAAGVPGTASFVAQIWGRRLVSLRDLRVYAGDLAVTGAATFSPDDGSLILANLSNLSIGATSLDDVSVSRMQTPAGDGWEVQIAGGRLDAAPWLQDEEGDEQEESNEQAAETETETPQTPLKLQVARLQSVHLGEDRSLEAVSLQGERGPRGWERLALSAEVPRRWWRRGGREREGDAEITQKLIRLDWGPSPADQGYALEFGADDLGAVLRVFGWVDEMEGGQTRIVGSSPGPLLSAPIEAQLELRQYTLVQAPLLGRIVAAAALGGLTGMLSEDNGITFERGTGAIVFENGVLSTDLLRAYGPALGITARGTMDIEADAIELQGTLVPAYAINQVLGAIPILGPLLTGGEGEGVLGVTYSVSGTLDDPDVGVNVLSALAPGFLRGIFSGKIEGSEEALQALPPPGGER
ncbi:MAG: YhdP family protein [Kiloniellales bacterium]